MATRLIFSLVRTLSGLTLAVGFLQAGQQRTALSGRVSEHGSPIAGAIVTVSNPGFVRSVTTDTGGRFALTVPPGRYGFRVTAQGYAIFERPLTLRSEHVLRNRIEVRSLAPIDQQTVSLRELAPKFVGN